MSWHGWTVQHQWRAMTLMWLGNHVPSGLKWLEASSSCHQGTKEHSERILRAHAAVPPVAHHRNRSKGLMLSGGGRCVHCFSFSLPCLDGCDRQDVMKLHVESYRCMFSRRMNRRVLCTVQMLMGNANLQCQIGQHTTWIAQNLKT